MSDEPNILDQALSDLAPAHEQRFPGSARKMEHRKPKSDDGSGERIPPRAGRAVDDMLGAPIVKRMGGVDREFYTSLNVALALNRQTQTVRRWIQTGVLPPAPYKLPASAGGPEKDKRLWGREHVEGLRRLAEEHRIITRPRVPRTELREFTEQAFALFADIKKKR